MKFSKNQLERYPVYLKYFNELESGGQTYTSSPSIAAKLGFSEEQVRKDLQAISNEPGKPKKGRSVRSLIRDIETFLGYKDETKAVLIGVGHLGGALLNYPAFKNMGLAIVAGLDSDKNKIGTSVGGIKIYSPDKLKEILKKSDAKIVVIAVPATHAQRVADEAIASGAKAIWNFAPAHLEVEENIVVENVNLASSLAVLSHRLNLAVAKERK